LDHPSTSVKLFVAMSRCRSIVLVMAFSAACDAPTDEAIAACDLLTTVEQPTQLQSPFAAGEAVDATIYAVDGEGVHQRVFVSAANGLRRVPVAGSGTGGDASIFEIVDHEPPFTLEVTRSAGKLRMWVLSGEVQDESIVDKGEELELLADEELAGLPVFDLPTQHVVEYVATSDQGHTVAVFRPLHVESENRHRLFFGVDALIEREISSFARQQDGGTTTIVFDVDGADGTAFFPFFPTSFAMDEPATLTLDGETSELTLLEASSVDDAEFRCLVP